MSPALQAVVGLGFGYLIGMLSMLREVRLLRHNGGAQVTRANALETALERLQGFVDRSAACPSCNADREILRSGCTPPRAGVDA